jgi:hypothetical protein
MLLIGRWIIRLYWSIEYNVRSMIYTPTRDSAPANVTIIED